MASTAEKVDLFKEHKREYAQKKTPFLVDIGPAQYLTIDGAGAPGGEEFQAAIGAMYAMAYTIKFASKAEGRDFVVCKLECLWRSDPNEAESGASSASCAWTLMIRVPTFVGKKSIKDAARRIEEKNECPEAADIELRKLKEGACVQMLHIGPYEQECETVEVMRAFCDEQNVRMKGPHHEIYISDPRRVEPAKLKTILRYPLD